jgi:signal transduction histidine kinase
MKLGALNTLAGRLVLVTIAAIALSHFIAFALFINERSESFRKAAEANLIERVAATHERMRGAPAAMQNEIARSAGGRAIWFSLTATPVTGARTGAPARVARAIAEQVSPAEVRAASTEEAISWPPRRRFRSYREDDSPPRGPPDDFHLDHGPPQERRVVTMMTVDAALGPRLWLHTRAVMPAPSPVPASIWFAAIASMLAVGAGAVLISRQIGKPLSQLAAAAERLGQGEVNVTAPVSGPDDVRRASSAFNAMAERLGRQLSRQRQMLWALSHDLRTPITALKLRAELVEDEASRQRLIEPLDEMQRLTEQALSLARAGASDEARVNVDLAEIARTLCGELQDMGVDVRAETDAAVFAECRPSEIARALRNLAENAARHGGGGVMRVHRGEGGEAVAEVLDEGPGVPPDLLERLTEPFFRADPSRAQTNGAGLGLAIAQAIAEAHGGRLDLANRTPRGFSAKLVLPG